MFGINKMAPVKVMNYYADGAEAQMVYRQVGWGPFTQYEVEVVYVEPDEYDPFTRNATRHTHKFPKMDHAEAWAYTTVLEHRLNG